MKESLNDIKVSLKKIEELNSFKNKTEFDYSLTSEKIQTMINEWKENCLKISLK